jgi:predicted acylesterase/phospholipase RssA
LRNEKHTSPIKTFQFMTLVNIKNAGNPKSDHERDLGITFAAGGNRAFYQAGLLRHWGNELFPRTRAVAACSAGACVATFYLSERHDEITSFWRERRKHVTRNFVWRRLLKGERPNEHEIIYRDTLMHAFADGGLERIRQLPFPLLILASLLPSLMPSALAAPLAICAYQLEKKLRPAMIHPTFGRKLGFAPVVYDARDCATPRQLADLVIASSATPPFTSVGRIENLRLLDGGVIDNVPASITETVAGVRRNLVLLTRPYPSHVTGRQGSRLYIAPTHPVPVGRWDYTRLDLLDATIAMGEREAMTHRTALDEFLA